VERSRLLWQNDAIAKRDVQQAEADARMSLATLESTRERLAMLSIDTLASSDEIPVKAPRAGVVIDVGAAPGEFSKSLDNSNPLCTLADLTVAWAVGEVYERDLASVKTGNAVEVVVDAYPGTTWRGRVDAIGSSVDTTTRTLKVRVTLNNPNLLLKPDMFGRIRVARAARSSIVIPQSAVLREGTSNYVFVQRSPGRFARRAVELGRDLEDNRAQVRAGLTSGDTIVVEGTDLLRVLAPPSS
jgi:cobalt-zinc-cadmium efflux system membrane fusion protein